MSNARTTSNYELDNISEKLNKAAEKAVTYFLSKLQVDGSYGREAKDISCYYKSPMMFINAGKPEIAKKILKFINKNFMSTDGDFRTSEYCKSVKPELTEYWSYINGWILRAAGKTNDDLNMMPLSLSYINKFYVEKNSGFLTNTLSSNNKVTDILTSAHLGLVNLELNNFDLATSAGNYLCDAINHQPDLQKGIYLRLNENGEMITEFSKEQAPFYFIDKNEPNQLYFMIGYPCAYLALLYSKTKEKKYIDAAISYLEFALSCNENLYKSNFSHKMAWAASLVYLNVSEEKYLKAIEKITNLFLTMQSKDGIWFPDESINTMYDQSPEIACWFFDIASNLNSLKKKITSTDNGGLILFSNCVQPDSNHNVICDETSDVNELKPR